MRACVVGSFLLAATVACGEPPPGSDDPSASTVAVATPVIADLEAVRVRLNAAIGRPVLLNFWATWCAPCVAELPELAEVGAEFADRGLVVITISYDYMVPGPAGDAEVLALVKEHLDSHTLPLECLVFDEDDYQGINAHLDLPGPIPVTLALGADGKEVARVEDRTDAEGFRRLAEAALTAR